MRICMVAACPFPSRRGTPLRVERLAQALTERGHEVEVVTYQIADAPGPMPFPVTRILDRETYRRMVPGPNLEKLLLLDPLLAHKVWRRLRPGSFDLVHAHHYEGLITAWPGARRHGLPIVYDAHTMLKLELPTYFSGPVRPLLQHLGRTLDRRLPAIADHICAVTPEIRNRLVQAYGFDPAQISVVSNGVEIERFTAFPPGGTPGRLIYCGTLAPYQRVELLLRAFALARRTHPWLRLCLSVSSPPEPALRVAQELEVADAIEIVEDDFHQLPARLAGAAVAVLPRVHCDGIPQKLLNYMAAAKPTVAFAGSAKVLWHEETGLIVRDADVEDFAAAIVRLVDSPEQAVRMGAAARAYVVAHHTWAGAAARAEQAYVGLVGVGRERQLPSARQLEISRRGVRGGAAR